MLLGRKTCDNVLDFGETGGVGNSGLSVGGQSAGLRSVVSVGGVALTADQISKTDESDYFQDGHIYL